MTVPAGFPGMETPRWHGCGYCRWSDGHGRCGHRVHARFQSGPNVPCPHYSYRGASPRGGGGEPPQRRTGAARKSDLARYRRNADAGEALEAAGATKVCRTCGRRRPISDFPRDRNHRDGHKSDCRECTNEYQRRRRERIRRARKGIDG